MSCSRGGPLRRPRGALSVRRAWIPSSVSRFRQPFQILCRGGGVARGACFLQVEERRGEGGRGDILTS